MGQQVVTAAQCRCSYGSAPATFSATSLSVSASMAAGGVRDVKSGSIATFGMCSSLANPAVASATSAANGVLTPQLCVPVLAAWSPGARQVAFSSVASVDDASTCSCSWGGVIQVTVAGQTRVVVR